MPDPIENEPTLTPNPNPNPAPNPTPGKTYTQEEFDHIKNDMHKFKTELQTEKTRQEDLRIAALKEKNDWKSVAEENEKKLKLSEEKYNGLSGSLVENAKTSALKEAALKAGMLKEGLDDLEVFDFDEISVETTSRGKILVSGADQAIENLKKRRPHWFGSKPPSVNPASPELQTPTNGSVTLQDLSRLEAAYNKAPQDNAAKKAYSDAIQIYKKHNPT